MATKFYNNNWRMPRNANQSKASNFSMEFDGTDDYVDCGTSSSLEISGDVSISAWVYITAGSLYHGIVSKRDSGGTNYQFYTDNSAIPKLRFYDGSTTTSSTGTVSLNIWHHVAITVDSGVTNGTTFYIDGVASGTGTWTITSDDANLIIGAIDSGSIGSVLTGNIDHVAVFDYALTLSEVQDLYGNSTDGVGNPMDLTTDPVAYYKIGDLAAYNGTNYLVPNAILTNFSNYALDFDGIDFIGLDSDISISGNKTVSFWINPTVAAFGGTGGIIFGAISSYYYPYIQNDIIYINDK